jgi:hypothetical protein
VFCDGGEFFTSPHLAYVSKVVLSLCQIVHYSEHQIAAVMNMSTLLGESLSLLMEVIGDFIHEKEVEDSYNPFF